MNRIILLLCGVLLPACLFVPLHAAEEQPVAINIKRLSMEMALKMAQAAITECRKQGVQVGVTVVDRGGHPQVILRDVLAMDLTLDISRKKAYTAMSFNTDTSQLGTRAGSALAQQETLMFSAGGVPVTASGTILGGIGVSGAPSGATDEKCAKAGVAAVTDDLEMGTM